MSWNHSFNVFIKCLRYNPHGDSPTMRAADCILYYNILEWATVKFSFRVFPFQHYTLYMYNMRDDRKTRGYILHIVTGAVGTETPLLSYYNN